MIYSPPPQTVQNVADTDNKLDPFTIITSVEWGGGAVEITDGNGVVIDSMSAADNKKLTVALWFNVAITAADGGPYSLVEFANFGSGGASVVGVTVADGKITEINYTITGLNITDTQATPYRWFIRDRQGFTVQTVVVSLALDRWHHLLFSLDASQPSVLPPNAVTSDNIQYYPDKPTGGQTVVVMVDGSDHTPQCVFKPHSTPNGLFQDTYTLPRGKILSQLAAAVTRFPWPDFFPDGVTHYPESPGVGNSSMTPSSVALAGQPFGLPGIAADLGGSPTIRYADVYMWSELAQSSADVFIDKGKPASPAGVVKALGTPMFSLSGGKSKFATNKLGSEGALNIVGTVTDYKPTATLN